MRVLLISLCFGLVHCTHFTMYRNEERSLADAKVIATSHNFWGLLPGHKSLVESELCPNSRIDAAEISMTTSDVLLTIATIGIYSPSQVAVTCSK